eukprot:TRINITY_DN1649_c0_g1_i3.p1 TRINITY_DN1649_c0_g1~~TRINITY_DN1649_c0_g1_i3.p1  ORF type:complete len:716 (+),score=111.68 TRINITY_DN1649_c0_g1_i3:61-2148(+)
MSGTWQAFLGAVYTGSGTTFRVWSPTASTIELIFTDDKGEPMKDPVALKKNEDNYWEATVQSAQPGTLYKYKIDGKGPFPDLVSRFQPHGVHGPSMVVDPNAYKWSHKGFVTRNLRDCVIYEMHIGTFTQEGTYKAAADKLDYLSDLGVTCIEILPLADWPGRWNWGYDGVALYSPSRAYGTPDELRALIDKAHGLGLTVVLDAVYNHLGPDGNYTGCYTSEYMSSTHNTPWGQALNLDGKHSAGVRRFLLENSLYWLNEYHFDGFRFDATHALVDDCEHPAPHPHFLEELASTIHGVDSGLIVTGEDERNLAKMVGEKRPGGGDAWGFNGVWSDDFHHQVRVVTAGDNESYFRFFSGTADDIATTIKQGWWYVGQQLDMVNVADDAEPAQADEQKVSDTDKDTKTEKKEEKKTRGSDPKGIPHGAFVVCIQNHDQVGNRPDGDRLHHVVPPTQYLAASALMLLAPQTPLLFQGQEWACSTPFCFFTDHNQDLGKLVTEGRRREFKDFSAFAKRSIESIPDPQAEKTFRNSCLKWEEAQAKEHVAVLQAYKQLLALRKTLVNNSVASSPTDKSPEFEAMSVSALHFENDNTATKKGTPCLALLRKDNTGRSVLALFNFANAPVSLSFGSGEGAKVNVSSLPSAIQSAMLSSQWDVLVDTSALSNGAKTNIAFGESGVSTVAFHNAGAVVLCSKRA